MDEKNVVFLDRDGTINVEKDYLYKIEDFEFLPNVITALQRLQSAGFLLIILTNQSGIARGYYTEEDYHILNDWMIATLKDQGVEIAKVYYCPHHPEAMLPAYRINCDCRKPKLGMYEKAVEDFSINLASSYAIGDKIRDCAICSSTGVHGYLISSNESPEIIDSVKSGKYERVGYAEDLLAATNRILEKCRGRVGV